MVIDRAYDGVTVFGLFAARARRRTRRSLLQQTILGAVAAAVTMIVAPSWWPVAMMLGAAATYAAWGLLDRLPRSPRNRLTLRVLAAATTVMVLLAIVGVGLAAFTGDGRSPYGTCYEANGRSFACDAQGQRRV
jgi:hypothetical protein